MVASGRTLQHLVVVLALCMVSGDSRIISGAKVSLPEEIDVRNSSMRTSRVRRKLNDLLQVVDHMWSKDNSQIGHGASERIGREPIDVAVVGEGSELAGFVLGEEEGCAGIRAQIGRVECKGDVEEGVDGEDVGVPLDDGRLDVALRGGGYGVEHAR